MLPALLAGAEGGAAVHEGCLRALPAGRPTGAGAHRFARASSQSKCFPTPQMVTADQAVLCAERPLVAVNQRLAEAAAVAPQSAEGVARSRCSRQACRVPCCTQGCDIAKFYAAHFPSRSPRWRIGSFSSGCRSRRRNLTVTEGSSDLGAAPHRGRRRERPHCIWLLCPQAVRHPDSLLWRELQGGSGSSSWCGD